MDDNTQPEPTIGRLAQDRIGRELRTLYGPLIEQPLPDAVSALLGALDDFETARNRLQDAVQSLRSCATDSNPAATQRSAGLSVHAQQMLATNAMLRGRPPRGASRHRPRADRAGR